ncbi:MAG TPA: flagellar motor protein [Steroidobacteraceae bacterium]|nr:flagellar motor protein [Steroidobacteraceae bacterium]
MDILSVVGLALAFFALVGGAVVRGAGIMALVSAEAFIIVVIGTCAAICVQTPLAVMKHALSILPWAMKPPPLNPEKLIQKMVEWSNVARKQGLLGLEPLLGKEEDTFVRKALQLVVDGSEPDVIRGIMEVELDTREHTDTLGAKVFEGMGIYSPTLGIIGAVLGLISVMQNLADPSKLGQGIASAFTATIYGVALANLFFLPLSAKLKVAIRSQTQVREMIIEGMISIAQGENPRAIESKLQGYLH